MASNLLLANLDLLFTLAEDMADGLAVYQGAIGVLQNTEPKVSPIFGSRFREMPSGIGKENQIHT